MHSTELFIDTARFYVREQLEVFLWSAIMLCVCLTIYFVIFCIVLIKVLIVTPIDELIYHICNP